MTPEQLQAIRDQLNNSFGYKGEDGVIRLYIEEEMAHSLLDEIERLRGELVIPKPDVSLDGNQWCALYGDNLQVGVAGFGDTVEDAYAEFVANWIRQALEGSQ